MTDVLLAQRAEHRVADRVHQRIGVRMAVQTFRMWNLHAAKDELTSRDQLMNVVTDAYMNHADTVTFFPDGKRNFAGGIKPMVLSVAAG